MKFSIKRFYKKHKDFIVSSIQTFITIFIIDGGNILMSVYQGDFTTVTLKALLGVALRAMMKTFMNRMDPQTFPVRKSK